MRSLLDRGWLRAAAWGPVDRAADTLRWRMLAATLATGVVAGLGGVVLTFLLHAVQHLAFGYTEDTFLVGVEKADAARRVIAVACGGLVAGAGWWLHRRAVQGNVSVTHALAAPTPDLALAATVSDAVLQIVAVGTGGSLGREGAPRQVGAALGALVGRLHGLTVPQRRTLVAAGAGAGFAAVYNVPLGGAVFTVEVLLATAALPALILAVLASGTATVVAWPFLGSRSTYQLPSITISPTVVVAALVIGPVCGILGVAFRWVMTRARTHARHGWRAVLAMPLVFAALGALAIAYPQLLGNGKSMAEVALTGSISLGTAAALSALKPVATAACLGSSAIGGLLTPSFATGAALGLSAFRLWNGSGATGSSAAFALVGAAALLAVTQRAPLTAIVLAQEFTHVALAALIPVSLAVVTARLTERSVAQRPEDYSALPLRMPT